VGGAKQQCGRDLAKCCHLIGVEIYLWPAPQAKEAYGLEIVEPLGPTTFNNLY